MDSLETFSDHSSYEYLPSLVVSNTCTKYSWRHSEVHFVVSILLRLMCGNDVDVASCGNGAMLFIMVLTRPFKLPSQYSNILAALLDYLT